MNDGEETSSKQSVAHSQPSDGQSHAGLAVAALCLLLVGMWWSLGWTFPDGTHMDFWGFVQFWGRELLLVVLAALALLLVMVLLVVKWLRTRFSRSE
jgi:hypothetical protein